MFEKFFGKIKGFFKKNNSLNKIRGNSYKNQNSSDEQNDDTLGNVSGGQGPMQTGSHRSK